MEARRARNFLPALYAIAIVLVLLLGGRTVLVAVIVVGAMLVGAGYAALSGRSGPVSPDPGRAARRAGRRDRRGG